MKKFSILCVGFVVLVSFLFSEVKNPDKPLKGEWDFKLKKVWAVDSAGSDVIARGRHLLVSEDGTHIYLYDSKNKKYFMFTADGKFVKNFAPQGEGPGEVREFYNASFVKDKLIVVDNNEIEYFTEDGGYIKSVRSDFVQVMPDHFITEDECFYFPLLRLNSPDNTGKIHRYNFKTKEKKVIAEFLLFKGGYAAKERRGDALIIHGITPMMTVGYAADKLYYGFSDTYEINIVDYNGKKLGSFSLDREKTKITLEDKRNFLKRVQMEPDMLENIIKSLPDELTYYTRIDLHNDLVYVYKSYLQRSQDSLDVDIFSPDGKYLYLAHIHAGDGLKMIIGPTPLVVIKNGYIYFLFEDENDEISLAKYEITIPQL